MKLAGERGGGGGGPVRISLRLSSEQKREHFLFVFTVFRSFSSVQAKTMRNHFAYTHSPPSARLSRFAWNAPHDANSFHPPSSPAPRFRLLFFVFYQKSKHKTRKFIDTRTRVGIPWIRTQYFSSLIPDRVGGPQKSLPAAAGGGAAHKGNKWKGRESNKSVNALPLMRSQLPNSRKVGAFPKYLLRTTSSSISFISSPLFLRRSWHFFLSPVA